jgi:dipeptidyl aminopeptidase/acylaminoacyl peptidase
VTGNGGEDPNWSPDGSKIVFTRGNGVSSDLYVINADGTNEVRITNDVPGSDPAWSPDGSKIVFSRVDGSQLDLHTINVDGTGDVNITNTPDRSEQVPDWQPVKPAGYPRPRAATPVSIRLVPASKPCTAPNATHGAPLSSPSCSPPSPSSDFLTVGTPDANLMSANFTGLVSLKAISPSPDPSDGDQADVTIEVSLTDVRRRADLTDYTGEVGLVLPLRVTDRFNGSQYSPSIHPATATDTPLRMSVACTATDDVSIGSTCSATTSADSLMPGIALERQRAVWGLGQVQVYDGGADGDADTTGDNTLFAVQGLFAP